MSAGHPESLELARLCRRALEEKKAADIRVIDVAAQSSITNYLVLATATSEPHVRALRIELEKVFDATHSRLVGIEALSESGWTVMDAFDVMVHIFTAETRARYRLEELWKDGREISVDAKVAPRRKSRPAKPTAKSPRRRPGKPR